MSIAKAAVVPVLLASLGVARGAEFSDTDCWRADRRDPLEYCTPEEAVPPPPGITAAELAQQAEERFALGDFIGSEGFVDKAFEALRLEGAGDPKVKALLLGP